MPPTPSALRVTAFEIVEGEMTLNLDDDGRGRSATLSAEQTAAFIRTALRSLEGSGAGLRIAGSTGHFRRDPENPDKVQLWLRAEGWPGLVLDLSWPDLRGLSQAAWAALAAEPTNDPPSSKASPKT